ncbi:MAG TPA: MmcQ/YjbR family DNA-binding protein [Steroidobacteraceae bacterium]|nr:MmcQ/YjbR family DNA-binding protein [Steroidobacteraceae bacterium]
MSKNISDAVREVCLSFPEAEEYESRGSPNYRVRGKTFATYVLNHHGDGRVALWIGSPLGAQSVHVKAHPKHFFVPPYVGPSGWLGINLDKGVSWKRVVELVREAYEKVAPPALRGAIGKPIVIKPPTTKLKPEEIDPLKSKRALAVLKEMRAICLALPESTEDLQFGAPVWKGGKKTFAMVYAYDKPKIHVSFWVGVERQSFFIADSSFSIPAYMGHNGWIALDVTKRHNRHELQALAADSFRHFANKRMLAALDPSDGQLDRLVKPRR